MLVTILFIFLAFLLTRFLQPTVFPSQAEREATFKQMIATNKEKYTKAEKLMMVRYDPSTGLYNIFEASNGEKIDTPMKFVSVAKQDPVKFYFDEVEQEWIDRTIFTNPVFSLVRGENEGARDYIVATFDGQRITRRLNSKIPTNTNISDEGKLKVEKVSCQPLEEFTFGQYADMFEHNIDPVNRNLPVYNYRIKCTPDTNKPYLEKKTENETPMVV